MSPEKKWIVYGKKADFAGIAGRFGIDPVIARVLRNRDVITDEEIRRFLYGNLSDLYPAELLPDAKEAAACLAEKIREGKKIRIVGDYDIDGVCATYILAEGLKKAGADIDYRIPERIRDGYGINIRIVEEAVSAGIDTLITCDNGIAAFDELKRAKDAGMTVILTDHHDIRRDQNDKELLPDADYIVSARLSSSKYPEGEICGAVTAWKLLSLVYREMDLPDEGWMRFLEFAGFATIGDVMKLTGENRIIAREALKSINRMPENIGLEALIHETGLFGKRISCYHIGFVLGPCINAGGRLETAEAAMRLFLAEDRDSAADCAAQLKELNESRKDLTARGVEAGEKEVEEKYSEDKVLVVYLPGLHESMAGIVAGRLKEAFGKPAIVLTDSQKESGGNTQQDSRPVKYYGKNAEEEEKILKGSGRSIEAWNMFEGLQKVSGLMVRFGGHPMAAGLSIKKNDLEEFRRRLNETCGLTEEDLVQKIRIDSRLPLSYVRKELVKQIEALEPFGNGNSKPLFAEKDLHVANMKVMGKNRNVLKMDLFPAEGGKLSGIMFGEADQLKADLETKRTISITYHPQINEYQGYESLQLQIEDYR